ncbi:patatin-like phospholipase family protein [Deltaproteobacteria bacterium TL4]
MTKRKLHKEVKETKIEIMQEPLSAETMDPEQSLGEPIQPQENEKVRMGLALGGGAARGIAHIGLLKALEEHDLKPDYLSGTSSGAFIACLYSFGMTPEDIRDLTAEISWLEISSFSLSKFGLISNDSIRKTVEKQLGPVLLENAPIPLAIIATDISNGEKVVLKSGSPSLAVMASTCIPGIFNPTKVNDRLLVDGVLVENVPISPLKEMGADLIIGVDLNGSRIYHHPEGLVDVLLNALSIAVDKNTDFQTKDADVLIKIELSKYSRTDSHNVWELYAEGYRSGTLAVKTIKAQIAKKEPSSLSRLEQKFRKWRES